MAWAEKISARNAAYLPRLASTLLLHDMNKLIDRRERSDD